MAVNANLSQSQIDGMLNEYDQKLDKLHREYELYFNGIERRPPIHLRKEVGRLTRNLEHKTFIQNTAQKFRRRSLIQRFNTHKNYWERILKQIEEGTFKRHIEKAKRNQALHDSRQAVIDARKQEAEAPLDLDLEGMMSLGDLNAELAAMEQQGAFSSYDPTKRTAAQAIPPAPATPPPTPPPSASSHANAFGTQPTGRVQAPSFEQTSAPTKRAAAIGQNTPAAPPQRPLSVRASKIAELQRKLGIEATPPAPKKEFSTQPDTQKMAHAMPQGAADDARDAAARRRSKLEQMKQRLEQRSSGPTARRSGAHAVPSPGRSGASPTRKIQRTAPPVKHDDQVERVYRNLVEAKRRCNEGTEKLTRAAVARSMTQQRERFRQSHNAKDVDFKVVIKNGKAFLKPEPK